MMLKARQPSSDGSRVVEFAETGEDLKFLLATPFSRNLLGRLLLQVIGFDVFVN